MTIATESPNLIDVSGVVRDYFAEPDNKHKVAKAISAGIYEAEQEFLHDKRWRVPRSPELRRDGFALYLRTYQERIEFTIATNLQKQFPWMSLLSLFPPEAYTPNKIPSVRFNVKCTGFKILQQLHSVPTAPQKFRRVVYAFGCVAFERLDMLVDSI